MLKKHKNRFMDIIKDAGLDPSIFDADEEEVDSLPAFVIHLKNSPLSFVIRNSADSYLNYDYKHTKFSPTFEYCDYFPPSYSDGWVSIDVICAAFEEWLELVVKEYMDEISLPDLWANLQQQKSFVSDDTLNKEDMSFFSNEEKTQLRLSINEFRLQIVNNFGASAEELKVIDDRLKYVADALDRLPRFDWKSLLLNSVLSISVALSLDSEKGKILYNLFKQVFVKIVYLLR